MAGVVAVAMAGTQAIAQIAAAQSPPPPGPGLTTIMARCSGCHSTASVFGQRRSRADWEATVQIMMDRGADLSADDQGVVVDYLAKNYGTPPAPAK